MGAGVPPRASEVRLAPSTQSMSTVWPCWPASPTGTIVPGELFRPTHWFGCALVRLNHPNLTGAEAQDLAGWAARLLDPLADNNAAVLLFRTIEMHLERVPALETFLIALWERLPPSIELGVARCEGLLWRVVRRRPSGLQQPGRLVDLALPNLGEICEHHAWPLGRIPRNQAEQ